MTTQPITPDLSATVRSMHQAYADAVTRIAEARKSIADLTGPTAPIALGMTGLREQVAVTKAFIAEQLAEVGRLVEDVQTTVASAATTIAQAMHGVASALNPTTQTAVGTPAAQTNATDTPAPEAPQQPAQEVPIARPIPFPNAETVALADTSKDADVQADTDSHLAPPDDLADQVDGNSIVTQAANGPVIGAREERVKVAKELLRTTSLSTRTIAERTGLSQSRVVRLAKDIKRPAA